MRHFDQVDVRFGGRAARRRVSAIVPVVTHLPSRNTRDGLCMIGKHFHSYRYKMPSYLKIFSGF